VLQLNPDFAHPDFVRRLQQPRNMISSPATRLTRQEEGRVTHVFRANFPEFPDRPIIVKQYRPGLWLALKECFRLSRAQRVYGTALRLQKLTLQTAVPVAALDVRRFGWVRECYFLALEVPHAEWMRGVRDRPQTPIYSRRLIRRFAILMAKLHNAEFAHTDPTLSNFLVVHDSPDQPQLVVIDLDALRPGRSSGLEAALEDFPKLIRRIPMSPREQLWFVAQYCRTRTGRPKARELAFRLGIGARKS
jgi:hypothetical protein